MSAPVNTEDKGQRETPITAETRSAGLSSPQRGNVIVRLKEFIERFGGRRSTVRSTVTLNIKSIDTEGVNPAVEQPPIPAAREMKKLPHGDYPEGSIGNGEKRTDPRFFGEDRRIPQLLRALEQRETDARLIDFQKLTLGEIVQMQADAFDQSNAFFYGRRYNPYTKNNALNQAKEALQQWTKAHEANPDFAKIHVDMTLDEFLRLQDLEMKLGRPSLAYIEFMVEDYLATIAVPPTQRLINALIKGYPEELTHSTANYRGDIGPGAETKAYARFFDILKDHGVSDAQKLLLEQYYADPFKTIQENPDAFKDLFIWMENISKEELSTCEVVGTSSLASELFHVDMKDEVLPAMEKEKIRSTLPAEEVKRFVEEHVGTEEMAILQKVIGKSLNEDNIKLLSLISIFKGIKERPNILSSPYQDIDVAGLLLVSLDGCEGVLSADDYKVFKEILVKVVNAARLISAEMMTI